MALNCHYSLMLFIKLDNGIAAFRIAVVSVKTASILECLFHSRVGRIICEFSMALHATEYFHVTAECKSFVNTHKCCIKMQIELFMEE